MLNSLEYFSIGNTRALATVICLHGLGASGRQLSVALDPWIQANHAQLRFIFPDAPVRAVTVNGGLPMRAWYDIYGFEFDTEEDTIGLTTAREQLNQFIQEQIKQGANSKYTVLAGFSQGGALALYAGLRFTERLGGIVALSSYLPLAKCLSQEGSQPNQAIPIFMAHGNQDTVLSDRFSRYSCRYLKELNYPVEFRTYQMGHTFCQQELQDLTGWLEKILPLTK